MCGKCVSLHKNNIKNVIYSTFSALKIEYEIISINPFCKIIRIFAFFNEFSW